MFHSPPHGWWAKHKAPIYNPTTLNYIRCHHLLWFCVILWELFVMKGRTIIKTCTIWQLFVILYPIYFSLWNHQQWNKQVLKRETNKKKQKTPHPQQRWRKGVNLKSGVQTSSTKASTYIYIYTLVPWPIQH
jgi:hypothetical protein